MSKINCRLESAGPDRSFELSAGPEVQAWRLIKAGILSEIDGQMVGLRLGLESQPLEMTEVAATLNWSRGYAYSRYQRLSRLLTEPAGSDDYGRLIRCYWEAQLDDCRNGLPRLIRTRGLQLYDSRLLSEFDNQILDFYLGLIAEHRQSQAAICQLLDSSLSRLNKFLAVIKDLLMTDWQSELFQLKAFDYFQSHLKNAKLAVPGMVWDQVQNLLEDQVLSAVDGQILTWRTGFGFNQRWTFKAIAAELDQSLTFVRDRWRLMEPLLRPRTGYDQALTDYHNGRPAAGPDHNFDLTGRLDNADIKYFDQSDPELVSLTRVMIDSCLQPDSRSESNFNEVAPDSVSRLLESDLLTPTDNRILRLKTGFESGSALTTDRIGQILQRSNTFVYDRLRLIEALLETFGTASGQRLISDYLQLALDHSRRQVSPWLADSARRLLVSRSWDQSDFQIMDLYLGLSRPDRLSQAKISQHLGRSPVFVYYRWCRLRQLLIDHLNHDDHQRLQLQPPAGSVSQGAPAA